MLARFGRNHVEHHQKSRVGRRLVIDRNIVEAEDGRPLAEGDETFRTAAYAFPVQESVRNRLVEVRQGREFVPGRKGVCTSLPHQSEIGHPGLGGIGDYVV